MDLPNQPQPKTLLLLTLKQNLNNLSCLFRTLQLTKIEMIGQRDNAFLDVEITLMPWTYVDISGSQRKHPRICELHTATYI
jgi:hypothetical protein